MSAPALDPAVLDALRQLNQPGEPDLVRQVLSLFLADAPTRADAIVRAVERRDAVTLQRTAHALKGASANIGASALEACCRELERRGRAASFDGAAELARALVSELDRVRVEIERYV